MPSKGEIAKTVTGNWAAFRAMGWTSPSTAINTYADDPAMFDADFVELKHAAAASEKKRPEPDDVNARGRQMSLAIQNIKALAAGGHSPEEIQVMVDDFIDGSGWSLNSIRKIAENEIGMIAVWARDFGKGL